MSEPGFEQAVDDCAQALVAWGVPYAFIGGVAVLAHGVARATVDVDVTLAGAAVELEPLVAHLERAGFEPRLSDAVAFARRSQVLLLRHRASGVPLDLTLAWLPFETQLLAGALERAFAGTMIRVPTVSDLVAMKLVAHRPKDRSDAELLARLHPVDFTHVRRVVTEFCAVLEDETRLATLDALEASTHET